MKAGNISHVQNSATQYQNHPKVGKEDEKSASNTFMNPIDTYTPHKPKIVEGTVDPATINRLWGETNHMAEAVRKLVSSLIGKDDATGQGFWAHRAKGGYKGGLQLSEIDRAQAQELISEDGFFGVKQTTQRIMDFAKALVGEDASEEKIELMRSAVQKGFDEVARLFGGFDKLPEVSKKTYDAIMKAFDEWLSGGEAEDAA